MISRTTRLRWRRRIRHSRRQVEDIGFQAEEHLEKHFFKRMNRLVPVRRFAITWVSLVVLLIIGVLLQTRALGKHYLVDTPEPGGIYTEGILGNFTNANPMYANGNVDSAVSRLVFSGLFKYDQQNQLAGDIADNFAVDDRGLQYTVRIKRNVIWHDGKPLTSEDVVFTYNTIQNPDAKSFLASSWQGIKITALDSYTVQFVLPNPITSFPHSLINGIVPKHILDGVPKSQLRSIGFNTNPVGSGPFKWEGVDVSGGTPENREQQVGLIAFEEFYRGRPKMDQIKIRSFHNSEQMLNKFRSGELNAMAGLDNLPHDLAKETNIEEHNIPITGEVMVFMKNTNEILVDAKVRRALSLAIDVDKVRSELGYPVVAADSPFLRGNVGYDKTLNQFANNMEESNRLLSEQGWIRNDEGTRMKNGKPLSFRLFSQDKREYSVVAESLSRQWKEMGINAEVILQPDHDLQSTVAFHNYDVLLYGISIGVDSDIFAYWHSSQADIRSQNRLNFSEYKSAVADKSLEGGRTRTDATLRTVKYHPFLESWRNDAPAIALYQPRFLYVTRNTIAGLELKTINSPQDRFNNVDAWMVRKSQKPLR